MGRDGLIFVCLFQIYFRILSKLTQLTGSASFDEGEHSVQFNQFLLRIVFNRLLSLLVTDKTLPAVC